jgi:hypothetical protein
MEGAMRLARALHIATIPPIMMLISLSSPAVARGGIAPPDGVSARHVEVLPPEIRKALSRWQSVCGSPLEAGHLFVLYLGDKASGLRFIALHFHELSCANKAALCSDQGCLHQVYALTDGAYRLVFSANVPDVTLKLLDHTLAVEIECRTLDPQCPRVLRWNGRRFGH